MLYFICTVISKTVNLPENSVSNMKLCQIIAISKVLSAVFVVALTSQEMPDPAKNEKRQNVENPEMFMLHISVIFYK